MKILGLDLGDRHIGVAILDTAVPVVLPLPALSNNRFFIKELAKLELAHHFASIVIGLPLTLAGTDSPQTRKVRTLADRIGKVLSLPVHLQDERFTTRQASSLLQAMGPRPAHHLDSVSAQLILEAWQAAHPS
jgi:putative Holliday junction resolvase